MLAIGRRWRRRRRRGWVGVDEPRGFRRDVGGGVEEEGFVSGRVDAVRLPTAPPLPCRCSVFPFPLSFLFEKKFFSFSLLVKKCSVCSPYPFGRGRCQILLFKFQNLV
jgi:hypothetical protein